MVMKRNHKIGLFIAAILAITSWVIALYYWGKLPNIIPTHFGWNGQPDAWNPKSVWYSFLLPGLQVFMLAMFTFLYYKPQYSDMPTTMWLMTMEEHKRDHAFELIRSVLVGTSLWIGVLLTYMTYGMNASAFKNGLGMNPWTMLTIVSGMLIWLVYWAFKVYRATKDAMAVSTKAKK